MKELIRIFDYEGNQVRTVEIDGEIWWVLKDVCRILGIQNHKDIASRLDEDEKGIGKIYSLGGLQEMTIINESGLYRIIFRSNKPAAKKFTRWVTHEMFPSITKYIKYCRKYIFADLYYTPRKLLTIISKYGKINKKQEALHLPQNYLACYQHSK